MGRCGYCQGEGHYRTTCPQRIADEQAKQQGQLDDHDRRIGQLETQVGVLARTINRLEWVSAGFGALAGLVLKLSGSAPLLDGLGLLAVVTVAFALGFVAGWSLKLAAAMVGLLKG